MWSKYMLSDTLQDITWKAVSALPFQEYLRLARRNKAHENSSAGKKQKSETVCGREDVEIKRETYQRCFCCNNVYERPDSPAFLSSGMILCISYFVDSGILHTWLIKQSGVVWRCFFVVCGDSPAPLVRILLSLEFGINYLSVAWLPLNNHSDPEN